MTGEDSPFEDSPFAQFHLNLSSGLRKLDKIHPHTLLFLGARIIGMRSIGMRTTDMRIIGMEDNWHAEDWHGGQLALIF